jgi:hypothetical protein
MQNEESAIEEPAAAHPEPSLANLPGTDPPGGDPAWLHESEVTDGGARVKFEEEQESPEALQAKIEAIKEQIAELVRGDSRERAELTWEEALVAPHLDLRYGKILLGDLLTGMAADERYSDIKEIITVTGLVFVYSAHHIPEDEALAKSVVEEAKSMLAGAIRSDSRDSVRLTPVSEIFAMAPDTDAAIINVLLKGMPSEARYADIRQATAPGGEVYYHSDTYLTGSYAVTMMLAMAGNHLATIAETIREDSRLYPRTTNVTIFRDQKVYGVPSQDLETVLWHLVRRPEYADIKRIVHPETRAVHMYSDTYITEASAWAMMDWEEVGQANNP